MSTTHQYWDPKTGTVPCCGKRTVDLPANDTMAISSGTIITCPPDGMGGRAKDLLLVLIKVAPRAQALAVQLDPIIGTGHYGMEEQREVIRLLDTLFGLGYEADALLQGFNLPPG